MTYQKEPSLTAQTNLPKVDILDGYKSFLVLLDIPQGVITTSNLMTTSA